MRSTCSSFPRKPATGGRPDSAIVSGTAALESGWRAASERLNNLERSAAACSDQRKRRSASPHRSFLPRSPKATASSFSSFPRLSRRSKLALLRHEQKSTSSLRSPALDPMTQQFLKGGDNQH